MNLLFKTENLDWACSYLGAIKNKMSIGYKFESTNDAILFLNKNNRWDLTKNIIIVSEPEPSTFKEYDLMGFEKMKYEYKEIWGVFSDDLTPSKLSITDIAALQIFKETGVLCDPSSYYPLDSIPINKSLNYSAAIINGNYNQRVKDINLFFIAFYDNGKSYEIADLTSSSDLEIIKVLAYLNSIGGLRLVSVDTYHPTLAVIHSYYNNFCEYTKLKQTIHVVDFVNSEVIRENSRYSHVWGGLVSFNSENYTEEEIKVRAKDWKMRWTHNYDVQNWYRALGTNTESVLALSKKQTKFKKKR